MNPRGRGPLTTALREAAKSLPSVSGKRSLILIHDDADNCQQNVCAAAEELRRSGHRGACRRPRLEAERRGDDGLSAADHGRATVQCAHGRADRRERGGGAAACQQRCGRRRSAGRAPPSAQPTPAPGAAAIPADGPPGLYLRALLAASTEPVSLPLNWTVFAEGQPEAILFAARAANPYVPVAPGRYVVEVRDGPVSASQTRGRRRQGPTAANLVLNAGTLLVRAQAQKSGAPLGDAIVAVSDAGQAAEGKKDAAGPPLAMFKGSEGLVMLPAGRYLVRVEQGLVRAERSVVVPAGSQGRIDVPLNAARLLLSAAGHDSSGACGRSRLQRRRGRPGRAEGPARGGPVRRPASRFRAPARHLLRGRAAGQRGGARASRGRSGRRGAAHAQRGRGPSRACDQACRRRAGAERAGLLPRGAPRRRCPGGDHDQPRRARCWFCRAAAIASKAATGP